MKKSFVLIALLFLLAGCSKWMVQPGAQGISDQLLEPTLIGALIETVTALSVVNAASVPVNPYATPIGIGLAGIIAMLEALRRKEKSARKFAEHNNNVQNETRNSNA